LERLRQVLRHAADAEQRQIAAWVIAYAGDKRTVVDDLLYAVSDPEPWVRNNATRALGTIAKFAQDKPELGIRISKGPFIDMLNSVDWTDRNKALSVLRWLTASRDAAVLQQLREQALPALVEMARWKFMGHAYSAYYLLCRVDGLTDEEIAETLGKGEKEAVIARIAESSQNEK
jgi:HEAT repeat protein